MNENQSIQKIQRAYQCLEKVFGFKEFRGAQKEVIETVFQGEDAVVLMPTGGGKSLCYQIPALSLEGVGLVISPLISLMSNQVNALKLNGVGAAFLNSSLDYDSWREVTQNLLAGKIKILYVSPEGMNSTRLQQLLESVDLSLIAIDEAHCVSQWGHEFRKDYIELDWLKDKYPHVPLLALTATADQRVRKDIVTNLKLNNPREFITSFDRPNISYHIRPKSKGLDQVIELINKEHPNECGIIYCQTRNKVDQVTDKLQKKGLKAISYHAGMSDQERSKAQNTFEREDDVIVVATIAFGMGIDKPNVRFVAHMDMPKNIENYYQETGRAGRDGNKASAWMFYGLEDLIRNKHFLERSDAEGEYKKVAEEKIDQMLSLCEATSCRRQFLLGYFGETLDRPCGNCDICLGNFETEDLTKEAQMFLSAVFRMGQTFGSGHTIDVLRGVDNENVQKRAHQNLSVYGIGKHLSASKWRDLARNLIFRGFLSYGHLEYKTLILTEKSRALLKGEESFCVHKKLKTPEKKAKKQPFTKSDNEHLDDDLLSKLRDLRMEIANELGVPAFYVFSNKTLEDMTQILPQNREQFLLVHGVGQKKCESYGELFIEKIKEHV